jgi:hypothetical protein
MEHANLCFESAFPVVQIGFRHSVLDFSVDTGAQNTDLYQAFANTFSDLVKSGKRESHKLTGVGGSANVDSVILPLDWWARRASATRARTAAEERRYQRATSVWISLIRRTPSR